MGFLTPVAAALTLAALVLPVSLAATNLALGALTAALLLRARGEGRRLRQAWKAGPAMLAMALYAAAGLAAALFAVDPHEALRDASKDLHRVWALGLFMAAVVLEPDVPVMKSLAASFAVMAAYGIGQTALGGMPERRMIRAHGFVHAVVYGQQMALGLLGGLCVLARPGGLSPAARRAAILLCALSATALALSQTRMALFAMTAGFAAIFLLEPRARKWALPVALAALAAAAAWEFLPTGGRTLSAALGGFHPNSPHQARWALWDAAWRMFCDHPWSGAGPGGYKILFPSYHAVPLDGETNWGSAHNLYLHQLAERGLLGAAALAFLIGVLVRGAWRAARRGTARGLWAAASVTAFLVMSVTETSFQNEQFATLFLLIWAWGTADLREGEEFL
ncbi:MAG TPA: hypothetical protein DCZ01_05145 [Elusimicrobia bacterium]|nr:MAG: hypothetical protein A2040_03645 [Rhodocyclales bacterium GWA2_65_19]HAZ07910.1 hypothetical protein [Elusimicrobiota bacterium]